MSKSEPTSVVEKMIPDDEAEASKAASDVGKNSKVPNFRCLTLRYSISLTMVTSLGTASSRWARWYY